MSNQELKIMAKQMSDLKKVSGFSNFSVKAKGSNGNPEIRIFGEIGEDDEYWGDGTNNTINSLIGQIDALDLKEGDVADILITSQGGSMVVGNAVHNYLKNHPAKFNGIVLGEASSSAFTILMGCDERKYHSSAFSLIHNPWSCGCGNHNEFAQLAEQLKVAAETMIDIYVNASNSDIDRDYIVNLMDDETYISAETALGLGFATEVISSPNAVDEGRIDATRAFFANQKACFSGNVQSKNREENTMSEKGTNTVDKTEKGSKSGEANGDVGLQAKNNILQERLNKVEADLKASNEQIKALKDAAVDVETAIAEKDADIRKEVVQDMKECAELTTKARACGFKAEGDNSVDFMRNVLVEAGVPSAIELEGNILKETFQFALDKNANLEVDDTFIDEEEEAEKATKSSGADIFSITKKNR